MLRKTGLFVLVAWSLTGAAWAQDVLLTQVSGEVRVAGKEGARTAVPLLKVADGDTLTLASAARVQMVYLSTGRQEVWSGAGSVSVGAQEGRSTTLKPETTQLPPLILKQLAKTPAVGQQTRRTGMVMVRSLDDLAAEDELEKDYADFRAKAAAGDPTPEVFLLTGLIEFRHYDRARTVLADLRAKHGSEAAYRPVIEHFQKLVDEAAAQPARH